MKLMHLNLAISRNGKKMKERRIRGEREAGRAK